MHTCLHNFPNHQSTRTSLLIRHSVPNYVARWPLTRLPACGKLRPNLLCATGACQSCHWLRIIQIALQQSNCGVLMHTCLHNFPNHQSTRTSLLIRHSVPNHVARWPLTRLPACGKLRPNLLCATGACQSCHWLRIMCWCIHVCTTSQITRVLVRACWSDIVCQTMWLVDPWHTCLLVESCVPIYFVPQVLVNLVIGLGSYRLLSNNLIAVCWCIHVCTTSRITSVLVRACWSDIVCQTMWLVDPWHTCLLVESCVPIYFVPQVLVNLVIGLGSYRLLSNNLIAVCWCIHVCTTSRITRVLVRACWSDIVCQTMWLVDPWHTCLLVESCVPIYFVPQVLVNLVIGLGSYRLLSNNLIAVCWCIHVCTTSRITRVLVRACWSDIVCQTMWLVDPWHTCLLVESCVPIYFVPQVLVNLVIGLGSYRLLSNNLIAVCWCIHVCTTSRITRVLVRACWSDIVCQTMWLVDPWHTCLLVESCVPIYFVPQVLVNLVIGLGSNHTDWPSTVQWCLVLGFLNVNRFVKTRILSSRKMGCHKKSHSVFHRGGFVDDNFSPRLDVAHISLGLRPHCGPAASVRSWWMGLSPWFSQTMWKLYS